MRDGNDDEQGGAYFIKLIEKRLLVNYMMRHVKVLIHIVSLDQPLCLS